MNWRYGLGKNVAIKKIGYRRWFYNWVVDKVATKTAREMERMILWGVSTKKEVRRIENMQKKKVVKFRGEFTQNDDCIDSLLFAIDSFKHEQSAVFKE